MRHQLCGVLADILRRCREPMPPSGTMISLSPLHPTENYNKTQKGKHMNHQHENNNHVINGITETKPQKDRQRRPSRNRSNTRGLRPFERPITKADLAASHGCRIRRHDCLQLLDKILLETWHNCHPLSPSRLPKSGRFCMPLPCQRQRARLRVKMARATFQLSVKTEFRKSLTSKQ